MNVRHPPQRPGRRTAWWYDDHLMPVAQQITVFESEQQPMHTGLLNADGLPIMRNPPPRRIGYVIFD